MSTTEGEERRGGGGGGGGKQRGGEGTGGTERCREMFVELRLEGESGKPPY